MKRAKYFIIFLFHMISGTSLFAQSRPQMHNSQKAYIQSIVRSEIERKDSIKQVLEQLNIKVNNTEKELNYANQKVNDYHELFKDQWNYFGIMLGLLGAILTIISFVSFTSVRNKIKEFKNFTLKIKDIEDKKIPELSRLLSLLSGIVSNSKFADRDDRNLRVETISIELMASYNAYNHSKRSMESEKLIRSIHLIDEVVNLLNSQALLDVFKHNNTNFKYRFDESKFGVPEIITVLESIIDYEPSNLKTLATEKLEILRKEIKNLKGENGIIEGRIN